MPTGVYIRKKDVWNKGKTGLQVGFWKGKEFTQEHRKKLSEAKSNNPPIHWLGRKHSDETKKKMSLAQKGKNTWSKGKSLPHMRGENSGTWIKDRSKVVGRHNRILHDSDYKVWRRNVYERDSFKCKITNEECSGRIEAHHILGWAENKELRYNINNGITLCHAHHPKKRAEEKRLAPRFTELVTVSK
jgi:predicted restriction endonuclease